MSLYDSRLFSWLQPRQASPLPPASRVPFRTSGRARQTVESTGIGTGAGGILEPPNAEESWRLQQLDANTLERVSGDELTLLLADLSPELSKAVWDLLRFTNPGYEVIVKVPGSDEPHGPGQEAVQRLLDDLQGHYGSADVPINRSFMNLFFYGGVFAELVLDKSGRAMVDLVAPPANTARFREAEDPLRGKVFELGQLQNGYDFIPLDEDDLVIYAPLDPLPGSPYGRPIVSSALYSAMFLLGLLHDLRRVVAQQGYPRIDIEVRLETLLKAMPLELQSDPDALRNWINDTLDEIKDVYEDLEPDDAYIHTDVVAVNRPIGTLDASSLSAVDGLIRAIERMITRGVKTIPLLMGSNEATTETHANRQWEIHVAGIKSLQHIVENVFAELLEVGLQAEGILGDVEFRFAELRASEILRDAQAEQLVIANAKAKYEQGWISQDEASLEVTGAEPDLPAPRRASYSPFEQGGQAPQFGTLDGEQVDTEDETQALAQSMLQLRLAIVAALEALE